MKINPQDALSWYDKGNDLKSLGRTDEANKAFDEALKINPQIAAELAGEANKTSDEASKPKAPGFEMIFAIAGLFMIAHLLRKKG